MSHGKQRGLGVGSEWIGAKVAKECGTAVQSLQHKQ